MLKPYSIINSSYLISNTYTLEIQKTGYTGSKAAKIIKRKRLYKNRAFM